jgi:glutamate synthase (NADPH/NADH) small chain
MADPRGFIKVGRENSKYRPVNERVNDFKEVTDWRSYQTSQKQASRCMDCGVPFCHWSCPLGNYIPEYNDLIFQGHWGQAFDLVQATHNFPEITGRICPAFCEYSCVLGINDQAVTIRENELAVTEYAFSKELVKPMIPKTRTDYKIAVVGSGPAGLACADQLNQAGHRVVVFERDDKPGGILRYGIPDFKLEKWVIDRRLKLLRQAGIKFRCRVNVGVDYDIKKLRNEFEAICLTTGSRKPRDLKIPGRNLRGIHFALEYLMQANKTVSGQSKSPEINACAKKVLVIGGGDTGANCVGVAHRQKAASVTQVELMPKPPKLRTEKYPWPQYPLLLKTTSSHQEGGQRYWRILTKKFIGRDSKVKKVLCAQVKFNDKNGRLQLEEVRGSEFYLEADLVIIAIGFIHPEHRGLISQLNLKLDNRNNVAADKNFMTSNEGVFAAGDVRRGQSLVVWSIAEGRRAAYNIDKYLKGSSCLPVI